MGSGLRAAAPAALLAIAACHTPADPLGADMTVEVPDAYSVEPGEGPSVLDEASAP